MRWLLIALLVSMGVLLLAAAGVARHVWIHRKNQKQGSGQSDPLVLSPREETDLESEG